MAVFEFKGLNEAGKSVNGLQDADSAKSLRALLRRNGVFLTDVVGTRDAAGARSRGKGKGKAKASAAGLANREVDLKRLFGGRVGTSDVAIATRQLATLLERGRPAGRGAGGPDRSGREGALQAHPLRRAAAGERGHLAG